MSINEESFANKIERRTNLELPFYMKKNKSGIEVDEERTKICGEGGNNEYDYVFVKNREGGLCRILTNLNKFH